jgi:hypothetical protein
VWQRVGFDPTDAAKAQMRQEAVLAERSTQTDERGLKRWRWELELFSKVCGKIYLHEASHDCLFRLHLCPRFVT